MNVPYPNLRGEIAKRGVKKSVVASALGISDRALRNKMDGITPFTWPEVCVINQRFFLDLGKDFLFSLGETETA